MPASEPSSYEGASAPPSLIFIPDETFDDTTTLPSPPLMNIPIPPIPIPPIPSTIPVSPPPIFPVDEFKCRGRSLSRSPTPSLNSPVYPREYCHFLGRTPNSSRSPSRSRSPFICGQAYLRARTPSPLRQSSYVPPPVIIPPPPPMRCMTPPHIPPALWSPHSIVKFPVDILTFHFNKNMAYAPAAKTYDVRYPSPPSPFNLVLRISSDPLFFL
jgi:hypothetical protein